MDSQDNAIHKQFEKKLKLINADTDNLVYSARHYDIHEWIWQKPNNMLVYQNELQ